MSSAESHVKVYRKNKILVQLQLVITSKVSNSLTHIKSGQNVRPDLGPNCLKGLSADDNVM